MPYNFATDSFHTKKLCSRLSSSEVRFYTEIGRFAFLRGPQKCCRRMLSSYVAPKSPTGATYDDHLGLIGKRVVDFLLALTELF